MRYGEVPPLASAQSACMQQQAVPAELGPTTSILLGNTNLYTRIILMQFAVN